jgi:Phage gp6-like head-tail connector protein
MPTQEQVSTYALTTLARVKDRLQITPPDSDAVLTRIINGATDLIERECGKSGLERFPNDGHFVQKKCLNEVYSVQGTKQDKLVLRNAPVTYLIVTGNLTAGSATVTGVTPNVGIVAGMPLYAIQGLFPSGTTVLSASGSAVTMSQPAQVTQANAVFEISGLISFQYRAGTPDNPSWTDFFPPQYELDAQGYSGIIRVYGPIPRIYSNMIRATYVAGFPKDWENAGNGTTHQVPADLTNLCEDLVERIFKRRGLAGKSSESLQGATISFRNELDAIDLRVIENYRRVGTIF